MNIRSIIKPSHPFRRIFRKAAARHRLRVALKNYKLPKAAVYFPLGGIGDDLLITALCRPLRIQTGSPIWVMSNHPALFSSKEDVSLVLPPTHELAAELAKRGVQVTAATYTESLDNIRGSTSPKEHILTIIARKAAIRGQFHLRPWLELTRSEYTRALFAEGTIILQSSGASARFPMETKEWYPHRFSEVAAALKTTHTLVQIGSRQDPPLPVHHDLRGHTTLRELAALLNRARLFIGLVGFPMHLARAVDCPAVIVYGGRESPDQSGYEANENLFENVFCAPCWLVKGCPHDHICMKGITSKDVLAAVSRQLTRPRHPLPVSTVNLGE